MLSIKWIEGCQNYYSPESHPHKILPIDFIIIHHTGSFNAGGTENWFTESTQAWEDEYGKVHGKQNKNASAHYLITEEGEIWQFVKLIHRAWHAGRSKYFVDGKWWKDFNRMSIGIELEGDGNVREYTNAQYDALDYLCRYLTSRFNIPLNHVLGHEQIAPKRKVNPGKYFNWRFFYGVINEELNSMQNEEIFEKRKKQRFEFMKSDELVEPQKRPPLVDGKRDTIFDFIVRIILLIRSLFGRNR